MTNIIVAAILVVIVGGAICYIVRAKRHGAKCIGCPADCHCAQKDMAEPKEDCGCGCCQTKP